MGRQPGSAANAVIDSLYRICNFRVPPRGFDPQGYTHALYLVHSWHWKQNEEAEL